MAETRIKALRHDKGYTQEQVAQLIGIDQSDYSKIENGQRFGSLEQCKRLALVLETSVDYLIGITDEKTAYPVSDLAKHLIENIPNWKAN